MKEEVISKFNELLQISDTSERIHTACDRFSKGEISAKVIRMLFEKLNYKDKILLMDSVYAKNVRKDNMRRLPPEIFKLGEVAEERSELGKVNLLGTIGKYQLINLYEASKTQDRLAKLNKVLGAYEGNSLPIYSEYKNEHSYFKRSVDHFAIKGFLEDIMISDNEFDVTTLNLPSSMTIGVEIECVGANKNDIINLRNRLIKYDIDFLKGFTIKNDRLC